MKMNKFDVVLKRSQRTASLSSVFAGVRYVETSQSVEFDTGA